MFIPPKKPWNISEPWTEKSSPAGGNDPVPAACADPITPLQSPPGDRSANGARWGITSPGAAAATSVSLPELLQPETQR